MAYIFSLDMILTYTGTSFAELDVFSPPHLWAAHLLLIT